MSEATSSSLHFWQPIIENRFQTSPNASSSSSEQILDWFDRELDALAEPARLVKARRNDSTLISRLPPEILANIFFLLKDVTPPQQFQKPPRTFDLGWIRVGHVCQSWRDIVIRHNSLWSYIDCGSVSPAWRSEFLRRSRQAPLQVLINVNPRLYQQEHSPTTCLQEIVQIRSQRLRSLTLYGPDVNTQLSSLYHLLPALEFLTIENNVAPEAATLDFNKLATNAPKLKYLRLTRIAHASILTHPFAQLASCLFHFDTTAVRPSFQQWKTLLLRVPNLEHLYLDGAFPLEFVASDVGELPAIVLPAGVKLTLVISDGSYISPMLTFLKYLVAPSARTYISFRTPLTTDIFSDILTSHEAIAPGAVHLEFREASGMLIALHRGPWPESSGDTTVLQGHLKMFVEEVHDIPKVEDLCRRMQWNNVTTLTYVDRCPNEDPQARWLTVASLATEVRRLRVAGQASLGLLRLFTDFRTYTSMEPGLDAPELRTSNVKLFPKLESLSFFKAEASDCQLGSLLMLEEDRLLTALALRRLYGMPVRDLKLPGDILRSEMVERLKTVVPKIGVGTAGKY